MMKAAPTASESAGVAAVDRALGLLETIAAATEPRTLADLAAATGLYKSTILRLIGSLDAAGYVTRLRDGRYTLGATAFRLGVSYERATPLRQHALPVLRDLVDAGSESASLHVRRDQNTRLCLLRVDSRHATLDRLHAGDLLPLERGAAGRVLLAFAGAMGAAPDAVRAELFTVSRGERDPGCAGMAAPVFGPDGAVLGALSLSGANDRFTDAMIATWRPKLINAALDVTRSLGGCWPSPR